MGELGVLVTAGNHGEKLRIEAGEELAAEIGPGRTQARYRARLLDAVRPASRKATRGCGHWPITKQFDGGVEVVRRVDGSGCRYAGTATCGAVHACPDCGIQERAGRKDILLALLDRVRQTMPGAAIGLCTLKLRHKKGDDGRELAKGLQRSASRMRAGAAWKRERKRGLFYVSNFDLTHGYANGWHPHAHVLIIHPEGVPEGWSMAEISDTLQWPEWVAAELGEPHRPSSEHGVHIEWTTDSDTDHAERLAKYVGKLNLAHEITDSAGAKRARMRGHRTPWEIAEDIARLDEVLAAVEREPATPARDRRLEKMERKRWEHLETWRELVRITKGIHLHDGRQGLRLGREWLELQQKAARLRVERTAAENGHEPPPEVVEEERVAVIPEFDWRAIRQHRQTRVKLLEAAARQGLRGVLTVVGAMPPMELRGRVNTQYVEVVCARGRPVRDESGDKTYTLRIWTDPPELWLPEVACANIREATAKDWNPPELEEEIDRRSWSAADYVDT